jgi:DNA-binding NarL/FixJ family response regulator
MTSSPISTLLVDDHPIVREGIRRILEESGLIEVIAEASEGVEAIRKADQLKPNLIVMDLSLAGMSGLEALGRIHDIQPDTRILVLTMHDSPQYAVHALRAGANGYLLKDAAASELLKAVKEIFAGHTYVIPCMAEKLMVRYTRRQDRGPVIDSLSKREFQVFALIGSGSSVREAAQQMSLSERTVSTYRARILQKLQLRNNAEIIRLALESRIAKRTLFESA